MAVDEPIYFSRDVQRVVSFSGASPSLAGPVFGRFFEGFIISEISEARVNGLVTVLGTAFLLGTVPFGLIFARVFGGADIRHQGSGNIGATNVSRVVGFWPAGFLTFLCDTLKGCLAIVLSGSLGESLFGRFLELPADPWGFGGLPLSWAAGLAVVSGHCFSPWLRFRGGKGVATGFGVFALLAPWAALSGILGFIVVFLSTRTGSLASLAGLLILVISHVVLPQFSLGIHLLFGSALVFMILARHESNLDALLEKREKTF
jgi:glycerol-3-phosphate acyltransferase PlsY